MKVVALLAALLLAIPALAEPHPWEAPDRELAAYEMSAGVGAAALTIPTMMKAGEAIGHSSSSLAAAAMPGLLLMAIIPPVAVTAAEWGVGRAVRGPKTVKFHPTIWAAFCVNLVAIVVGSLAGVTPQDAQRFAVFTIADGLAMPLATMFVLHYTERRRAIVAPPPEPARVGVARAVDDSKRDAIPALTMPIVQGRF